MIYMNTKEPINFHKVIGTRVYKWIPNARLWVRHSAPRKLRQLELGLTTGTYKLLSQAEFEAITK